MSFFKERRIPYKLLLPSFLWQQLPSLATGNLFIEVILFCFVVESVTVRRFLLCLSHTRLTFCGTAAARSGARRLRTAVCGELASRARLAGGLLPGTPERRGRPDSELWGTCLAAVGLIKRPPAAERRLPRNTYCGAHVYLVARGFGGIAASHGTNISTR